MKAVKKHTSNKWVILYIARWLKAPIQMVDVSIENRTKGVPQGRVISPVLANLFLHYLFDYRMRKHYPDLFWCCYAYDGLIHFHTKQEVFAMKTALNHRFKDCTLEINAEKTKIIYCNNRRYKINYPYKSFDFLGYSFRDR